MRRWFVPLTVLGLGSIGLVLLSERGRSALISIFEGIGQASDRLSDWNDSLEDELGRIQATLDGIAESLEPHPGMGR
jgi:hypothetical protein